ncbi:MAG: phosphatase PAP2 family protein [Pseudomonadota bacterium]
MSNSGETRGVGRPVLHWWQGVSGWFSFVHNRKPDLASSILPVTAGTVLTALLVVTGTILLALFVDPPYLSMIQQEGWQPDGAFELITEFGRSDWFLYPTGIALIAFSLFRSGGMAARKVHRAHTIFLAIYFVFTSIAFSGLLTMLFKILFGRYRPEFVDPGYVWQSDAFTRGYEFASFPSGHATTAGAAAMALALLFPRVRAIFIVAGIWVAISRPALGVHFPSDVFAGFCFGAAFTYVYGRSFARKRLLFGFTPTGKILPRYRLQSQTSQDPDNPDPALQKVGNL